jgi:hypothetical protein
MNFTLTSADATVGLRRAPNPNVVKVGSIFSLNDARMIYPITINNQPDKINAVFKDQYPDLNSQGYNNLLICSVGGYSLRFEWSTGVD